MGGATGEQVSADHHPLVWAVWRLGDCCRRLWTGGGGWLSAANPRLEWGTCSPPDLPGWRRGGTATRRLVSGRRLLHRPQTRGGELRAALMPPAPMTRMVMPPSRSGCVLALSASPHQDAAMLLQHVLITAPSLTPTEKFSTLRAVDALVFSHLLSWLSPDELPRPREFPDFYAPSATDGPSNDASNRQNSYRPIK